MYIAQHRYTVGTSIIYQLNIISSLPAVGQNASCHIMLLVILHI